MLCQSPAIASFTAALAASLQELREKRLVGWRLINMIVIVLLVPGVLTYLLAALILLTSEPDVSVNSGVLPWMIILMLFYSVFLLFMCFGFVGALFRNQRLFKLYLVMLVAELIVTVTFFGEVLLLFQNAFQGGQFTVQGVAFTCGANETILILSVIDKTTGNAIPTDLIVGDNSNSTYGFDASLGLKYCDETRRVLIIVLIIVGIVLPVLFCSPCVYAGVMFFKELNNAKLEIGIDLARNPYGGNDPTPFDMPGNGPREDQMHLFSALDDGYSSGAVPTSKSTKGQGAYIPLVAVPSEKPPSRHATSAS